MSLIRRLYHLIRPPAVIYERCQHCNALNEYGADYIYYRCWSCRKVSLCDGYGYMVER